MKILIIGAGAAGITAGHLLAERSVEFEILEAGPVHGGRVRKIDDFVDFPIDLGAEWIHQWIRARPAAFTALLDGNDPRFRTFTDRPGTTLIWRKGKLRESFWLRFVPTPTDLKFADSTWFDALDSLATPEVLEHVRFNCPVTTIDYRNGTVVAADARGSTHTGDRVLVTVPIAMLKQETIRFEPPLPADKRAEIQKEAMPGVPKVFIEFSERFYPDIVHMGWPFGFSVQSVLDECVYYNAALGKDSQRHVLGLFAQGSKAERYTAHETDESLFAFVLAELDEMFDGKASQFYLQHVVQDWSREPFIGGSYSQRRASAEKLAAPVAGAVFFAGEAMNPSGKTIAVHGACESAYTAVEALLSPTNT